MNKTKTHKLISLLLAAVTVAGVAAVPSFAAESDGATTSVVQKTIAEVSELLNTITYAEYESKYADIQKATQEVVIDALKYNEEETNAKVSTFSEGGQSGLAIGDSGRVTWDIEIPQTARYAIEIEYFPTEGKSNSIERMFYINGKVPFSEARYLAMTKTWIHHYTEGRFAKDLNGNEIRPLTNETPIWSTYSFIDSNGFYPNPFEFYFEQGTNTIALEAVREPVAIKSIKLYPYKDLPSYEEYKAMNSASAISAEPIKIDGETPTAVSHMTIYPIYDRTSAITEPQDPTLIKLNTIGGEKWQTAGQWIRYEFEVTESGYYSIIPRFKQSDLSGLFTSRKLRIDGEIPFEEANYLRFNFANEWQTAPLTDGTNNFEFYFEKGTHTIEFEVTLGHMGSVIRQVNDMLSTINTAYLDILKLTGASPDQYRDYGFTRVMPATVRSILLEAKKTAEIVELLGTMNGVQGEHTATLEEVRRLLRKMGTDEDEIAKNLGNLKARIGSLGTWVNTVKKQPVEIDYILIQPASVEKLPKANANFFQAMAYEFRQFLGSFFTDYNSLGTTVEISSENQVSVWVNTGRDQAQVMRNLIDNRFTPVSNVSVNLKLVAGGTLLPSVLAGVGPDVSIGEADPINYAIRHAVLALNDFDTFEDVKSRFSAAAFTPVTLYGETFALPETQTFPMLFYRKDILSDIGVEIPKTWDDIMAMVPVLQFNNMEVGLPNDYNIFLYQMGGDLYADDGMRVNLDSNLALEAFNKMCNMFTAYSLPYEYDFANRFRTGEMPIAISSYTSYQQLTVFATEIAGLWEFVPMPGIVDEEGNINNVSVATISTIVMLAGTDKPEAAWKFMDWFVDKDYQANYANEIVAILGSAGMHATANIEAIAELPWTATEYENLMLQFNNLAAIPNYPGNYIIGRYTGFAFLAAYNDKKDPVDTLLGYVPIINKEISRKRAEFDLETLAPGQTLAEKRAEENGTPIQSEDAAE